jgi:tetratricopeptide (TPR) repeat protein
VRLGSIALVLAALSVAPLAPAQGDPGAPGQTLEDKKALAEKHLTLGLQLYDKKKYKDAIDSFLEANRLYPSPTLSFNAAKAYEKMGDSAGALRFYRDYLRRKPDASDRAAVGKTIGKLERALQDKGVQQVTVLSVPEGALVIIDEQPRGVTPWTGELVPGVHRVRVRAEAHADASREFELLAHRSMDVTLELESAPEAPAPPPPPPAPEAAPTVVSGPPDSGPVAPTEGGGVRPLTWVAFGVGAAALGGALFFELQRRSAEDDVKNEAARVDRLEANDRMEQHQTTARILGGVGAAFVVIGGVLLVIDLSRGSEPAGAQVGLGCAPGGCGAALRGAW